MPVPDRPSAPLWGKVTALALDNSPATGMGLQDVPALVSAFAQVKIAAARANRGLATVDEHRADAIVAAAAEVAAGRHMRHFPLRVIAAGGGTATNMNVNEVVAARATELASAERRVDVHPNDHVNRSQSSNDVYPTAVKLTLIPLVRAVAAELRRLAGGFDRQAHEHSGLLRLGRTGWQDAVAVPVAATHRGHAHAMRRLAGQLDDAERELHAIPLGGTVLGTGSGAPDGFAESALSHLRELTGRDLRRSEDLTDAFAHSDTYSLVADTAARTAAVLFKICQDLRILSSGPHGGLAEVALPQLQPGSSIMPGKNNPVIPNMVLQTGFSVRAAAYAVSMAVSAGEPDINLNGPAVVANLVPALDELQATIAVLNDKCVSGLRWNPDRLDTLRRGAYDRLIAVAEESGYEAALHGSPGAAEEETRTA
ncbi:aspartate ammonia-lyase [Murinocardiopsis flavida]|uniref:Aspartate ammonia-lyase n=1 Tax=Murinocardiopsis flavida TaxID=645275 RepID=A0A2P8DUH4_9ACTN|nr:lyase family protein [Murinocardiopsis flavida]PSL00870.1 aspartate ammonia-lyase [Murinocardiopsis flavida]